MRLEIGPVPSASATSWVDNARAVLAGVRRAGPALPVELPDEVEAAFLAYLDEWGELAARTDEFVWSADVDVEHVRQLVVYFFSLVSIGDVVWERHGLPFAPPESQEFYAAVSTAVTDALAEADREVGVSLKASWPDENTRAPAAPIERPMRVVIVDDTQDLRLLLNMTLTIDGRFEVVGEAVNGEEGIALCRAERPDAVLLDVMMPVLDGLSALPGIRDACPTARIVMLSANDSPSVIDEARRRGADAFVVKGMALEDAIAALLG